MIRFLFLIYSCWLHCDDLSTCASKIIYNPFRIVEWLTKVFSRCFHVCALSNFHISFCRDEHTDRLRSGTWAKDSRGSLESLPEVRRHGQRHSDFGSSEGEEWACVEPHSSGSAATLISWVLLVNDWLGACHLSPPQDKAGSHKEIYPYVIQELRPTLDELGISTPEELGIDKV